MATRYTFREPPRSLKTYVPTGATCDCCGKDAWHKAHRRPVMQTERIQHDGNGNMDIWSLDLCAACRDEVLRVLERRAVCFGRTLPKTSPEPVYTDPT